MATELQRRSIVIDQVSLPKREKKREREREREGEEARTNEDQLRVRTVGEPLTSSWGKVIVMPLLQQRL